MLSSVLTLLALGSGVGQPLPDQLDILRGADRTPQVMLLVDLSGSMRFGHEPSDCSHYLATRGSALQNPQGANGLSRIDQLIAVLTGCQAANDGILDRWAPRMIFAATSFAGLGSSSWPLDIRDVFPFPAGGSPAFSTNLSAIETAVEGMVAPPGAGTPLVPGYRVAAARFDQVFRNNNTEVCRPNAIVLMTDGEGNSGESVLFDQVGTPGVVDVTVRDSGDCYIPSILGPVGIPQGGQTRCGFAVLAPPHADVAAQYLWGNVGGGSAPLHDALPLVDGVQPIRTYTIGFSVEDEGARMLLQHMAEVGGGEYLPAENYQQLYDAFERIMIFIGSNAEASFTGVTVQRNGLISGNYIYQSSFQAVEEGHWFGNVKKFCLVPETLSDFTCVLVWNADEEDYVFNLNPVDLWSTERGYSTQQGGAGSRILAQMGTTTSSGAVPSQPYDGRNIVTWRPNQVGYIDVDPTDATFTPADTFTSGLCEHYSLLNKLYGYTYDNQSCAGAFTPRPVAFDLWPLADTVNGGQVLLKYTETCEEAADRCYVVTVTNAGMLHIFNAVTGQEVQAVIPPEFFRPTGVTTHILADVMDQPTMDFTRRFYFDGGVSLYHDDENANSIIESSETAYLIAGFGRGGAAYLKWDVSRLPTGELTSSLNPPHPIFRDRATGFQHLRDTWATPWLGRLETSGGSRAVAVFPTGHEAALDAPGAPFAQATLPPNPPAPDTESSPYSIPCDAPSLGIPSEVCSTPSPRTVCEQIVGGPSPTVCGTTDVCSPCDDPDPAVCVAPPLSHAPPFCYDWPGLAGFDPSLVSQYGITALDPIRISVGPYTFEEGVSRARAYQIRFAYIDLQPGDALILSDANGRIVQRFQGSYRDASTGTLIPVASDWIRSPSFRLDVVADGINDAVAYGYRIDGIDVLRDVVAPLPPVGQTRPGIYIVDLDTWEGNPSGFGGVPPAGDASQAAGILYRFTSSCSDSTPGVNETCIDFSTASDLRFMTCPISASPSVYTEGGTLRSIYFGDECGQVWGITVSPDGGSWTARRLLTTNDRGLAGETVAGRESRNYRKIFTPVEVVISTCTGRRALGVYFGTGNLQRPAAIPSDTPRPTDPPPNLEIGPGVFGFDIMGVVWDSTDIPAGGWAYTELQVVTPTILEIDTTTGLGQRGFYMALEQDEKILRPPLVFDGVAFFQSYRPTQAATECRDAVGRSRTYAFDNCTAAPALSTAPAGLPVRAVTENPSSTIGGDITAVIGAGETFIFGGDSRIGARANIAPPRPQGHVRLFLWRPNVD